MGKNLQIFNIVLWGGGHVVKFWTCCTRAAWFPLSSMSWVKVYPVANVHDRTYCSVDTTSCKSLSNKSTLSPCLEWSGTSHCWVPRCAVIPHRTGTLLSHFDLSSCCSSLQTKDTLMIKTRFDRWRFAETFWAIKSLLSRVTDTISTVLFPAFVYEFSNLCDSSWGGTGHKSKLVHYTCL